MDDHRNPTGAGTGMGGPANMPPLGDEPAVRPAQHPHSQDPAAARAAEPSETQRELERAHDLVAEAAAPVVAEPTQQSLTEAADRLSHDAEVREQLGRTAGAMGRDAQRLARERVDRVAHRAEDGIQRGLGLAADRLEQAAQRLDRLADQRLGDPGGPAARVGDLAHSVADAMDSAAHYLRDSDVQELQRDLERQVRERPVQTLLAGVAIGWLAGKILR